MICLRLVINIRITCSADPHGSSAEHRPFWHLCGLNQRLSATSVKLLCGKEGYDDMNSTSCLNGSNREEFDKELLENLQISKNPANIFFNTVENS